MTTTLTGSLALTVSWDYQSTDDLGIVARDNNNRQLTTAYTSGTGSNQVNFTWRDRRTISSATPNDDIDLYGALTDVFGQTINPTKIKELVIINLSTATGDKLLVGAAGTNPITSLFNGSGTAVVTVGPGGVQVFSSPVDGFTVSSGSADVLRVAHSGLSSTIQYDILIKGVM